MDSVKIEYVKFFWIFVLLFQDQRVFLTENTMVQLYCKENLLNEMLGFVFLTT